MSAISRDPPLKDKETSSTEGRTGHPSPCAPRLLPKRNADQTGKAEPSVMGDRFKSRPGTKVLLYEINIIWLQKATPRSPAHPARPLTELFKHLITFIQDKVFNVFEVEALISSQGQDAARGPHDNMRAVLLQHLFILLDRQTTKKHSDLPTRRKVSLNEAVIPIFPQFPSFQLI